MRVGGCPAGSSRVERLDPHALPLRFSACDAAADGQVREIELHRERVVQPGETITVYIPPLASGSYPFFDDFHRDTPPGAIVAQ